MHDIESLRETIDTIDEKIIQLLSQRMKAVSDIGSLKKAHNQQPLDPLRWSAVLKNRVELGSQHGLSPVWIKKIWNEVHAWALEIERRS